MPGSLSALAVLLSLVPGFIFLRVTDSVRQPSQQTPLQEAAEMVAVGVATTGVAVAVGLLIAPDTVFDRLTKLPTTPGATRIAVVVIGGILFFATLLSLGLAALRHGTAGEKRYAPNVWESVFGETKPGRQRHVSFELIDGRTFDGPLRSYTVSTGIDGTRQLAIKGPIRLTLATSSRPHDTVYDFVVVDSSAIRFAAMKHVPNKG